MQGQQQGQKLDINVVLKKYQEKVGELTNENIMLKAYIEQLEDKVKELETPAVVVEESK